MLIKQILFLIIFLLNFTSIFCHKCATDLLIKKLNMKPINTTNRINKRRLDLVYTPIQIKIDYTVLNFQKNVGQISNDIYQKYKTELESVANYLNKIIKVHHEVFDHTKIIDKINQNCYTPIKINNIDNIDSYDLIIFPQVNEDILQNNAIAAAAHCLLSEQTYRPIVGIILLKKELNSKSDIDHYIRKTLFHEFFHVLGFNYQFFEGRSYTENNYFYLNSSKLLEKATVHFGCDNIKGIRMEDQGETGTVGSHWDARYMLGELMIGEDYPEIVLSDMTLAFLEDLGFYQVNYYTGGLFRFGKNEGCAFLQKKCVYDKGHSTSFPNEFCTDSKKPFCSGSHTSKGLCYIIKYNNDVPEQYQYYSEPKAGGKPIVDYCPVSFYYQSEDNDNDNYNYPTNCIYGKKDYNDEIIGSNSMCFESSVNIGVKTSICYEMTCDTINKKINVIIGEHTITCDGTKSEITNPDGLQGTLKCPDYNMVCTSDVWCNDIFDCIDKQSTTDYKTFDYISNKNELKKRDEQHLAVDDNKNKYIWPNFILLFIFVFNFI